jgi:hypothetical protein
MATPLNPSFLPNNKYEFVIERLPNFTFYVQGVLLPSITLGATQTPTPFTTVYTPSNQLTYEQLQITYIVDEDMLSWFELYSWMTNLGNPTSFDKLGILTSQPGKKNSITSDATLLIKTNSNNTNVEVKFVDIFPIELTGFQFSTSEAQDFQTTSATFAFTYMTATKLT